MDHLSLYLMAALYVLAGLSHFRNPRFFLKMMPPWVPAHKFVVAASGVVEIALGLLLLWPAARPFAAWGIMALLVMIFPANIYMLTSGKFGRIPKWILWLRLPLQAVLLWWAYGFTH